MGRDFEGSICGRVIFFFLAEKRIEVYGSHKQDPSPLPPHDLIAASMAQRSKDLRSTSTTRIL